MSNQVKSIAIVAFKVSATVLLFLGKVIVYVAIALAVVGQLLFAEYAQSTPKLGIPPSILAIHGKKSHRFQRSLNPCLSSRS
jgi:hypothetical protein